MTGFCSLALILMLDSSGSMTRDDWQTQLQGTADAFRQPAIVSAIEDQGGVAVSVMQWATSHTVSLSWTILESEADALRFSNIMSSVPRSVGVGGDTALGNALAAGVAQMEAAPCVPQRRVIDISGDGKTNIGPTPAAARADAERLRVTINGLPVAAREPGVAEYYAQEVVTPDGFAIVADGWGSFYSAIRAKIVREISMLVGP